MSFFFLLLLFPVLLDPFPRVMVQILMFCVVCVHKIDTFILIIGYISRTRKSCDEGKNIS